MRTTINLNRDWIFTGRDEKNVQVDVPHTWNAEDGQDGGNDYYRGIGTYRRSFGKPVFDPDRQLVYLQFHGVNSSAKVELNGREVCRHEGGYSTFRADVTALLQEENRLTVQVDNSVNDRIYPQKADFTFYGGIYRDVELLVVSKIHFDLDYFGGCGVKVTAKTEGKDGIVEVKSYVSGKADKVTVSLTDKEGCERAAGEGTEVTLTIPGVHLWDGVFDPYLYHAVCRLWQNGETVDEVCIRFGVRSFFMDPEKGFFLNGRAYPLHGVSRHQDRKGIGNAISKEEHRQDMELIREVGANTVRLAHYQHDQYFYDLCDEYGMIVWAEIPYISEHMPNGRENTISQMKELIVQNYHHPSIVTWGVSNEITISTKDKKDMLDNHHMLNDLCHEMDSTRPTSLACYAVCGPFNKVAHITDLVSWNLYLGWYVPGLWLNDAWMWLFHTCYPRRCLGYSEYGAEGMPNLHSARPKRGDHTEEYQAKYHEYMLKCFARHPWLWATHVWNMFDFAADARDQGGEPGMNHKGLVTFDRKVKKDSFYLYKAYWSSDPFIHLCSKRFVDRTGDFADVKVYSNQREVSLYQNGKLVERKEGDRVFCFRIALQKENRLRAVSGSCEDNSLIKKADRENPSYKLQKKKSTSANWV